VVAQRLKRPWIQVLLRKQWNGEGLLGDKDSVEKSHVYHFANLDIGPLQCCNLQQTHLEMQAAPPKNFGAVVYRKVSNYNEFHVMEYHNNEAAAAAIGPAIN